MDAYPGTDGLSLSLEDQVLVAALRRPDVGNALRNEEMRALSEAVTAAGDDERVRALLLRAEGKHFCTGADLAAANRPGAPRPRVGHMLRGLRGGAHRLITALWDTPLPVVAAVQGRALGLGFHLALTADFIVAARTASFREPFGDIGFSADSGGTFLLPRLIGVARAKQMLLRGVAVGAAQARDWGLLTDVVEAEELGKAARELAAELAAAPTFAIGLTKTLIHRHLDQDLDAAVENEALAVELALRGEDFKEGIRAFAAKRRPSFTGR